MTFHPMRIGLVFNYGLTYCRGVMRGIKHYAEGKPDWNLTWIFPGAPMLAALKALQPSGLIAWVFKEEWAKTLAALDRPLVNVSGAFPDLPFPRVGADDLAVGRQAARHFLDQGLCHFGFVGQPDLGYSIQRETGFRRTIERAGHPLACFYQPSRLLLEPQDPPWVPDDSVERWLLALPKPVGVFACDDLCGLQLSEICRQAGLGVPEDVALLGVHNDDLHCELARPSLSSVAVPSERIGFEAAALLDRLFAGAKPPTRPRLLPPLGVVMRQSSNLLAINDPEVVAALRFIRDRGHLSIHVEDVVHAVSVSRRCLEQRFRKVLKRGLWEEIRRVHMEHAKRLLEETELPTSLVAKRSGFSDANQLALVFRQETGLTPTQYRRQFRDQQAAPQPAARENGRKS